MLHNINFFLDSLVKGDLREVKGVSEDQLLYFSTASGNIVLLNGITHVKGDQVIV